MTDKIRILLEDVQTVYEGKGMVVHPNSFDRLRTEVIKLDNINKQLSEQIEKMKCWCNCKNYLSCLEECCRKNISFEKGICYNCKKWEIK